MNTLDCNARFTVDQTSDNFSQHTVMEALRMIDHYIRDTDTTLYYRTSMDAVFDMIEDNPCMWITKKGKLTKRIARALHTLYGYTVPENILANVGEFLTRNKRGGTVQYIDTTQVIDWDAGDFGDSGSCFWGSNARAKDMIIGANGFAIRAYEDDTYTDGHARAWVIPVEIDGTDTYMVFNGYGERVEYFARVMENLTGGVATKITLRNKGDDCGTLYINSGMGYCIHDASITPPARYDFSIEDDSGYICENCDCRVDEDDMYTDDNGRVYCSDCYYARYARCEECDGEMCREDAVSVEEKYTDWTGRERERTATYCEYCAREKGYAKCEDCDTWTADFTGDEDHTVCMDCYDRGYSHCEDCECLVVHDRPYSGSVPDAYTHGNHTYCEDCLQEHKDTCPDCGAPSEDWQQCADCHSAEVRRREGWNEPQLFDYAIRTVTYTGELFDHVTA